MPTLLPVRPGSVSEEERTRLSAEGVVVFEHMSPSELVLPSAPNLAGVLTDFIGQLALKLPGYRITVTGAVTVDPPAAIDGGGGGPPLNADGSELPPLRVTSDNPSMVGYTHPAGAQADRWIFVAVLATATATATCLMSPGVVAYPLSSTGVASTTAPAAWLNNRGSYTLTAYRLAPGTSVSWQTPPQSPAVVVWSRPA